MKWRRVEVGIATSSVTLLWLASLCGAILSGYDPSDITTDPAFGCRWSGGTNTVVNCTCRYDNDKEMVIKENSIPSYSTESIEIQNCDVVRFESNSIHQLRSLRHIYLRDIPNLQFEDTSLYWSGYSEDINYDETYLPGVPSLSVMIQNSNITKMSSFTFKGQIGEIVLNNVNIENLETYAFTSLKQTQKIVIENTVLHNIKLEPFKKLSTSTLELNNVTSDLIPSRMFSNVYVHEDFVVRNCNFKTVRPGGFMIYNPKHSEISNTYINQLDGEGFSLKVRGGVLFKNNVFDNVNDFAFNAIIPNPDEVIHDKFITFDTNKFTTLTRDSLTISQMVPKFINLRIAADCDCKAIEHNLKNSDFYGEIKCLHDNEYITVTEFKSYNCSVISSHATTAIIVLVVVVLVIIITLALIIYYKKVYLSKKYNNEKMSKKGNLSLIVPDGRTYRETELHVIVERADLLTTDL